MVLAESPRRTQNMVYSFRAGSRVPANVQAEDVHNELCKIQEEQGRVTAETVAHAVERQGESHPLSWGFTFDVAAGMHKLHVIEAGHVIRSVVVTHIAPKQTEPVRAWVVTRDEGKEAEYAPTAVVVRQHPLREQLLEQVEAEYNAAERKRRELMALLRML